MWKNIQTNSNLLKANTGKAVLIKFPKSDFMFWHPSKLVKFKGKNDYLMSFGYTDDFSFTIFRKTASGNKVDEKQISIAEFEEFFK